MTEELEALIRSNWAIPFSLAPDEWTVELEHAYTTYILEEQSIGGRILLNRTTWFSYLNREQAIVDEETVEQEAPVEDGPVEEESYDYRSETTEQILARIQSEVESAIRNTSIPTITLSSSIVSPIESDTIAGQTVSNVNRALERFSNRARLYREYLDRLPAGAVPISLDEFNHIYSTHQAQNNSTLPDIDVDLTPQSAARRYSAVEFAQRYTQNSNYDNYRRSMGIDLARLSEDRADAPTRAQQLEAEEMQAALETNLAQIRDERQATRLRIDNLTSESAELEAQITETTSTLEDFTINRRIEEIRAEIQLAERSLEQSDSEGHRIRLEGIPEMTRAGTGVGVQLNRDVPPIRQVNTDAVAETVGRGPIGPTATRFNNHDFLSANYINATSINGATIGNAPIYSSFTQPKIFKLDPEQITNTMTMIRAFQAILHRFPFTQGEVDKLGIADLVAEQPPSTTSHNWS